MNALATHLTQQAQADAPAVDTRTATPFTLTVDGFIRSVRGIESEYAAAGRGIFRSMLTAALNMASGDLNAILREAYQPGGRGQPIDKTLANWASVTRNVYGAVRFCGWSIDEAVALGRDAASTTAAGLLSESKLKWTGETSVPREEAAAKRKQAAELKAALELAATKGIDLRDTEALAEAIGEARDKVERESAERMLTKYRKRLGALLDAFGKEIGEDDRSVCLGLLLGLDAMNADALNVADEKADAEM